MIQTTNQIIAEGSEDSYSGSALILLLRHRLVERIPAGCILRTQQGIYFELLCDVPVETLKHTTLLVAEPGSVFPPEKEKFLKNTLSNCTLVDKAGLEYYNKMCKL